MNNIDIDMIEGIYDITPDIIFNHFDLIYGSKKYVHIMTDTKEWTIPFRAENNVAYLGLYLVDMPKDVFDKLISFIFRKNRNIQKIYLKKSKNNYHNHIRQGNHFRVELPETFDSLLARLNKKGRYNYNREKRLLHELGNIEYLHCNTADTLNDVISAFFNFKFQTHGRDYQMLPEEYVRTYFVSDAYSINLDGKIIAVLLSCEQCDCVFLENLSYDTEYCKYSVGFQIYVFFLQEMIKKGKKQVYTGGGYYDYKKRFNSVEDTTYDGYIYRTTLGKLQSALVNRMRGIFHLNRN